MNEKTEFKPAVTVKNVLRVVSVLCVIFFICPTFVVSCSGHDIDISAANTMVGIKYHGDTLTKAHPMLIFALLLPLAVAVMLCMKKWNNFQIVVGAAAAGVIDFIIWLVFKSQVKKAAEENGCGFKTTVFFFLNMLCIVIIVLLSALVLARNIDMETDLVRLATGQETKIALNQVSDAVSKMSHSVSQMASTMAANVNNAGGNRQAAGAADIIGYCQQCGKPLTKDSRFCMSCGKPVPADLLAAAGVDTAKDQAVEQPIERVTGEIVDDNNNVQ